MALVFVFFVVPAMAADVCSFKSALPEAETSLVQMTNNELSAVRGGWARTFKNINIGGSSSTTISSTAVTWQVPGSVDNNQDNNVVVNTNTGVTPTYRYESRNGYRALFVTFD